MMAQTFVSLRSLVFAAAFSLALLFSPTAHAQSVVGSGRAIGAAWQTSETGGTGYQYSVQIDFQVKVSIDSRGALKGSLALTYTDLGGLHAGQVRRDSIRVSGLIVTGNQATVRGFSKLFHRDEVFVFTDNGDGSASPDYITDPVYSWTWPGAIVPTALQSGDITVVP